MFGHVGGRQSYKPTQSDSAGQNRSGVDVDWVYEMGLWGYTLSSPGEYD